MTKMLFSALALVLVGSAFALRIAQTDGDTNNPGASCFNARKWFDSEGAMLLSKTAIGQFAGWNNKIIDDHTPTNSMPHGFSQGNQDSVLESLFKPQALGLSANPYYVEFGFPSPKGSNTEWLRQYLNFNGTRFGSWTKDAHDGSHSNKHAYEEWITDDNIVSLFRKYDVPAEADYVSIDIDSCDLWVFRSLVNPATSEFRPRVVTVEFNSNYPFDSKQTLGREQCKSYSWNYDSHYGTSLGALRAVAEKSGYSLVYLEPSLDAFFVRNDLICADSGVDPDNWKRFTNIPMNTIRNDEAENLEKLALVVEYDE